MTWGPFPGSFSHVCSSGSHVASPRRDLDWRRGVSIIILLHAVPLQCIPDNKFAAQSCKARSIHHCRSARALHSTLGARHLALASRFVSRGDLFTIIRAACTELEIRTFEESTSQIWILSWLGQRLCFFVFGCLFVSSTLYRRTIT
jgi:hypothetical protein